MIKSANYVQPATRVVQARSAAERLLASHAKTPKDLKRLANTIMRDRIGTPLTRKQQAEQRPNKLEQREMYKDQYRSPLIRIRSPKDMIKRRPPGWTKIEFALPRRTVEGLSLLAKGEANRAQAERSKQPIGFRRRYPKTKNYYVVQALNYLFEQCGLEQFCVQEVAVPGRVPHFVVGSEVNGVGTPGTGPSQKGSGHLMGGSFDRT